MKTKYVNRLAKIFLITSVILISACDNQVQKPKEIGYLVGTWVLDSATFSRDNKFTKEEPCDYLTFLNDSDYTFQSNCGCIHLDFKGKYFVLNNPKRKSKTITLIPDIEISNGDTVRIDHDNFDIVKISSKRLQIVRATEFLNSGDLHLLFNKNEIYKKIK